MQFNHDECGGNIACDDAPGVQGLITLRCDKRKDRYLVLTSKGIERVQVISNFIIVRIDQTNLKQKTDQLLLRATMTHNTFLSLTDCSSDFKYMYEVSRFPERLVIQFSSNENICEKTVTLEQPCFQNQ